MLPDAATAARIHALAQTFKAEHAFTGNLILPEHLHVTLFHLGDWASLPEEIVNLASGAASQVNVPAFEVTFRRAESFRNSTGVYPFVLTGDKDARVWKGLHEALRAALTNAGLGGATRGDFYAACHAHLRSGSRETGADRADQLDRERFRADPQPARQDDPSSSGKMVAGRLNLQRAQPVVQHRMIGQQCATGACDGRRRNTRDRARSHLC